MIKQIQRLMHRFRPQPGRPSKAAQQSLSTLLEAARRAHYSEDCEKALQLLDQASELASRERNRRAEVDIALSRADIAIARKEYDSAEWVLENLRVESEERQHRAPLAYSLASLGVIAQQRGDWEQARSYYEQARKIATEIRADGAGGRATAHLADVYLAEANASYAIYLLRDAIPRLRRSGDRELIGYFQGQLGHALIESGHQEEGLQAIKAGLEVAFAIRHRAQLRHLHQLLGSELLRSGKIATAREHLEQAFALYPEEATAPKIRLMCDLSNVLLNTGEFSSAAQYAQDALSAAQEMQLLELTRCAQGALGLAQLQLGDSTTALTNLQAAIHQPVNDLLTFTIRRRIAHILLEQNQKDEAEKHLTQVIESARTTYPEEAARAAVQLGSLQQQQRQFRSALETIQQAESLFEVAGLRAQAIQAHCDIAALYLDMGDGRMAQREYAKTLEHLSIVSDPEIKGAILANIANAYSELGDIESAEEFYKDAITLAQKSGQSALETRRRGNFGRFLALTDRPRQALLELQEALKQSTALKLPIEIAVQSANIGLALAAKEDYAAAITQYTEVDEKLLELSDPTLRGQFLAHYADALLALDKPEKAAEKFTQALEIAEQHQQIAVRIHARNGLAEVSIRQGDTTSAQEHLKEAEPLAKRAGMLRLIARWYEIHAALLDQQRQTEKADTERREATRLRGIMRMPPAHPIQQG